MRKLLEAPGWNWLVLAAAIANIIAGIVSNHGDAQQYRIMFGLAMLGAWGMWRSLEQIMAANQRLRAMKDDIRLMPGESFYVDGSNRRKKLTVMEISASAVQGQPSVLVVTLQERGADD